MGAGVRVLDLFSGLGGWSAPARERGHHVVRVEIESTLEAEIHADIETLTGTQLGGRGAYDLVLASPPCEGFSVMNIGKNWHYDGRPKTPTAELGLRLVEATLRLVGDLEPRFWVMENPRAKLRKLDLVQHLDRRTVTYCAYGETRMKPTDLWSDRWPPSLVLLPMCSNGDPCHVRAPRGSRTGTQGFGDRRGGRDYWEKSVVPYALAAAITDAAERDMRAGHSGHDRSMQQLTLSWPDIA